MATSKQISKHTDSSRSTDSGVSGNAQTGAGEIRFTGGNMVKKFRKKPVVISAFQFDGTPQGAVELFEAFDIPASRVEELEKEVRELDAATDQLIGERDAAEDALQETHIALGGDGEWVAKMYATCPPDTGDLKLDVPELARQLKAELLAGAHAEEKE